MKLPVADIERVDPRGAAREEDVREASRLRSDIGTDTPLRVDREMGQAEIQLHSPARDPRMLGLAHGDLRVVGNGRPGLDALPAHDNDPAREDEGLGAGARFRETALDENDVQPLLQNVTTTLRTSPPFRASAKASAAFSKGTRCVTRSAERTAPRARSASASRMSAAPHE